MLTQPHAGGPFQLDEANADAERNADLQHFHGGEEGKGEVAARPKAHFRVDGRVVLEVHGQKCAELPEAPRAFDRGRGNPPRAAEEGWSGPEREVRAREVAHKVRLGGPVLVQVDLDAAGEPLVEGRGPRAVPEHLATQGVEPHAALPLDSAEGGGRDRGEQRRLGAREGRGVHAAHVQDAPHLFI